MNINKIIELLRVGISEDKLGISKSALSLFKKYGLINTRDIITSDSLFSLEGAIKLRIYDQLKLFGISTKKIQEIEKEYRKDFIYGKSITIKDFTFLTTVLSIPITETLAGNKYYFTINANNNIEYITEEEFIQTISYGKETGESINGRIIIDLSSILESFGIKFNNHSKGTINKVRKAIEVFRVPYLRKGKYYLMVTRFFQSPRDLKKTYTETMSNPDSEMLLKSNKDGKVTSIRLVSFELVESNKD